MRNRDSRRSDLVTIAGREYSRATYHLWDIDDEEAAYLQAHACLTGPDVGTNRRLREKLSSLRSWTIERSSTPLEDISFARFDTDRLDRGLADALYAIDAPAEDLAMHFWKLAAVAEPLRTEGARMLCMGAANGLECHVARLFNDTMSVTGSDFRIAERRYHDDLRSIPHAELLQTFGEKSFDLIYSNHVLEHVYGGLDALLANVRSMLQDGGIFVGGVPTEANPSNPYAHLFPEIIPSKAPQRLFRLNAGHPWKMDLFGIHDRLAKAGFSDIRLFTLEGSRAANARAVADALGVHTSERRTPGQEAPRATPRGKLARLRAFAAHAAATMSLRESALKAYFSVEAAKSSRPQQMHELLFVCSNS